MVGETVRDRSNMLKHVMDMLLLVITVLRKSHRSDYVQITFNYVQITFDYVQTYVNIT